MADSDKNVNYGVSADASGFEQGMQKASDSAKNAASEIDKNFKKVQDVIGNLQKQLIVLAGIVAGGTLFKKAIEDSNVLTGETLKLSKMLGITGQQAGTLATALGDIGSSGDEYVDTFTKFARQLKKNETGLQDMGLATRDANGELRDSNTLFTEALQAVGSYKAGLDQNTAAQTYFGRSIDEVMKLQKLNNVVLDEAARKNAALGLIITQDNITAAKAYKLAMHGVGDVFTAINKVIGDTVMPIFTDLANYFASTGPAVLQIFKGAMLALSTAFYVVRGAVKTLAGAVFESFSLIIDTAGLLGETLVKFIKGDYAGAYDAGKRLGLRFKQGAVNVMSNFVDVGNEADAAIKKTFAGLYGDRQAFGAPKGGAKRMGEFKDKNGGADKSRTAGWEAELAEEKLAFQERMNLEGSFAQYGKAAEKDFWSAKLALTTQGSQENLAVRRKMAELQLSLGKDAYDHEVATLLAQEAAFKNNLAAKLTLLDQQQALVNQRFGAESKEYEEVQKKIVEAKRAAIEQLKAIDLQRADAARNAALAELQGRAQLAQLDTDLGLVTRTQQLATLQAFEQDKNAIVQAGLLQRLAIAESDPDRNPVEINRLKLEIEDIERQHQLRLSEIRHQATKESQRIQMGAIDAVGSGWQGVFAQALQGQVSLAGIVKGLWASITQAVANALAKMAAEWAVVQLKNMVLGKAMAVSSVAEESAKAGAGGVASMAAAPFPLNLSAPGFGAAMAAAAMGFAPMASAAGGYDIPGTINPITQLHAREMVLPATYADLIRNMAANDNTQGQSAAPIHIHGSPDDTVKLKDLGRVLIKMNRNFEFMGR